MRSSVASEAVLAYVAIDGGAVTGGERPRGRFLWPRCSIRHSVGSRRVGHSKPRANKRGVESKGAAPSCGARFVLSRIESRPGRSSYGILSHDKGSPQLTVVKIVAVESFKIH